MSERGERPQVGRRLLWLAAAGSTFFGVYGLGGALAARRAQVGTWYHPLELSIPFVPWMIVPYWSIDLLFVAAFFVARRRAQLDALGQRVLAATLVAGIGFVLLPLQLGFPRPEVAGFPGVLFALLCSFDGPHNLFPSLHVAFTWILADLYLERARSAGRLAQVTVGLCFALIVVSTLLTWQHHVVDLLGGAALGILCVHTFRPEPQRMPIVANPRVGMRYALGALVAVVLAWLSWPWGALLLWPAAACAFAAAGYLGHGGSVYRKHAGVLPLSTRCVMAPCRLGQWLSLCWYRRRCTAWDQLTQQLWIGRVLTDREAGTAVAAGVHAVLDLTAEFTEPAALRTAPSYLNLPLLDLTAPTQQQLHAAVAFLDSHLRAGRTVYLHCKIGYSRSAAVAGAWLLASGAAADVDAALRILAQARPGIIVRTEARAALARFAIDGIIRPRAAAQFS